MKHWIAIAFGGLLLVCGVNLVVVARRVPPPARAPDMVAADAVMRHEERFAGVRRALEQVGVRGPVGYVADVAPAQLASHPRGMEEYFLTQFVLVPWVLDARADCRWSVANLHGAAIATRMPAGARVVRDFGQGVFLLERTTP